MATSERWLSVEDIAAHLAVSKESVYRWVEKGKLPSYRVGRLLRFSSSEVDKAVREGLLAEEEPATNSIRPVAQKLVEK